MTPPVTIVSVSSADAGGGAERVARDLHEHYRTSGDDAWLAVGRRRTGRDPRVVEIPNHAHRSAWARAWTQAARGVPARGPLFHLSRFLSGVVADPGRWRLRRGGVEDFEQPGTATVLTLAGRAPDALHLHNLHGDYFDLRLLPMLSARAATVVTLHDAWLLSGHCAHSLGCGRWETGCGACPALWIHPAQPRDATAFNWLRKREIFGRSALHVGVPCEWLASRVRRSMMMPGLRSLRVLPHGVDTDAFRPGDRREARSALGLDPLRAVFVTHANSLRERTWKDAETFRRALHRLGDRARAAQWVAIGEAGTDTTIGPVRVRRVPAIADDARLALWYRAADAWVHPARADTFPLSVLEAQACGTPVIATDVGGIGEQIVPADGGAANRKAAGTGWLVRPGDAAGLARAIDSAAALDEASRRAMGDAGVHLIRERFDRRTCAEAYRQWIHELVAARAIAAPDPVARA